MSLASQLKAQVGGRHRLSGLLTVERMSLTPYQIRLRPKERERLQRMATLYRRRPQDQASYLVAQAVDAWANQVAEDLGDAGEMGDPQVEEEPVLA